VAELSIPTTPVEAEPDPYAVLGVSPDAEDVVIRAAYRALLHKYTTPGRIPEDPVGDDARTRAVQGAYELLKDPEVRRAYDQHRRERAQAAAALAARAAPVAAAEPLVLKPEGAARRPPPRRRRSAAPLMVGLFLIAALGAGAYVLWRHPPAFAKFASAEGVAAPSRKPALAATAAARPLPCYVDGHSVGDLPLNDCAGRNGVATGQLEAGLDGQPVKAAASPIAPVREPAHARHVAENPRPADLPEGDLAAQLASQVAPPASPSSPQVGPSLQPPDVDQSMATVRAFYEALSDDDGTRAASLVEPTKRGAGPLSAQHITRFYSSLRQPLKLTSIYPLDPSTIFVRYQFVTADGRTCTGAANVATTRRNDQVLIGGIRAYSGC
jgi:hypothetical protein